MEYEAVAGFAKTWGLVYLFAMFIAVLIYALNPRSRAKFKDAARIPLKED